MQNTGIREVTEPIVLKVIEDRLHFTCISGGQSWTYSISLHKAANAAMCTAMLLEKANSRSLPDNVREFIRRQ